MPASAQGSNAAEPTAQEPHGTGQDPETVAREDYERLLAQSRKWEERSKANAAAAKRLAELEDASKTNAERLADANKRAEDAEAELARYRRADERREWAGRVAEKTGVPAEVLASVDADSEGELEKTAESLRHYFERSAAPVVPTAGMQPKSPSAGKTPNDWLRESIPNSIKRQI